MNVEEKIVEEESQDSFIPIVSLNAGELFISLDGFYGVRCHYRSGTFYGILFEKYAPPVTNPTYLVKKLPTNIKIVLSNESAEQNKIDKTI